MTLADDPGFALLLLRLQGRGLPPLEVYKDRCLRRRLAVRMRACGVKTVSEYAELLDRRPGEAERLLEAITINVTSFFRNPETWLRLEAALPALLERGGGRDRYVAWSAGCATGEESWTLAMLLAVVLERAGHRPVPSRLRVDATDVDAGCLDVARAGRYPEAAFAETPVELASRWTVPEDGGRVIGPALRRLVRFHRHDLARDPAPEPPYDVVVCRNVLIYFSRGMQEGLFLRFAEALRPGGFLLLGKVETLYGRARERFESVDGRERLFRRLA
jgi:chemotaxis methyl-accepting protein methylase